MSDVKWLVYLVRPAGTITAPDKRTAEAIAAKHWGASVAFVQSTASAALDREEAEARARARQAGD